MRLNYFYYRFIRNDVIEFILLTFILLPQRCSIYRLRDDSKQNVFHWGVCRDYKLLFSNIASKMTSQ